MASRTAIPQKPSAPSPTAISGAIVSPRLSDLDQKFAPACALARTPTWKSMSSLLPSGRRADPHQHALAVIFHAGLEKDTVGPA